MTRIVGEVRWRAKVAVQFVLARLPWAEALNYRIGHLLHPRLHHPETLRRRLPLYLRTLEKVRRSRPIAGATVFELGTGWTPIVPVLLHVAGAERVITVDKVQHLRFELARAAVATCRLELEAISASLGVPVAVIGERLDRLDAAPNLAEFLATSGVVYHAPADARSTGLVARSVDIWYSYSVLENIPIPIVDGILAEAARILAPTGVWFSVIGCKDPFAAGVPGMSKVNYLQFSDAQWAFWTYNQLAYNNRMRESDYVRMVGAQGFQVREVDGTCDPDDLASVRRLQLDRRFSGYVAEDLAIHRTELTAVPMAGQG